jgi:transposase
VPAAGEDARFTVYGALDYASGRLTWQTADQKNSATFVAFLDRLAGAMPEGQILVVLDNVGYHKSHAARRWWVAHRDRIRPLWLLAYAPELNLIERVWRHLKDKLSNHRWWADLPALERATDDAEPLPQRAVDPLPGAVEAPAAEPRVDGRPGWELVGQRAPLAPGAQHPVRTRYRMASTISRTGCFQGRPRRLGGGRCGRRQANWASDRSVG